MYRSEEGHLIVEYIDCDGHYDEYTEWLHNQMEYFGRKTVIMTEESIRLPTYTYLEPTEE